jgi:glycosyltransferase involved in cell wall biosynthesis
VHQSMSFSKESRNQGRVSVAKVVRLFQLIWSSYVARFRKGISFLYFSPGGPSFSAVARDAAYLLAVRPVMRSTMLVFHSSGVADYIGQLPPVVRSIVQYAFSGVRLAIQLSMSSPPDGPVLQAIETRIIPNAVPDHAGSWFPRITSPKLRILYMGVVTTGKGVVDLLLAAQRLSEKGITFKLTFVGSFISKEEENHFREMSRQLPSGTVEFAGPLTGRAKEEAFRTNDVFCFPSFWYTETFPLVLLEALSYGMPTVASRWRGIPDLLGIDGDCGALVDVHSIDQIVTSLEKLASNPELRIKQSRNARLRYEQRFRVVPFMRAYDAALSSLIRPLDRQEESSSA